MCFYIFFFQAEDGIRDTSVTGVQTCALPISNALNHPNILAIYDVATHDGSAYVVSELLEGETLRQRMGGTALSQRKAIDYARSEERRVGKKCRRGRGTES